MNLIRLSLSSLFQFKLKAIPCANILIVIHLLNLGLISSDYEWLNVIDYTRSIQQNRNHFISTVFNKCVNWLKVKINSIFLHQFSLLKINYYPLHFGEWVPSSICFYQLCSYFVYFMLVTLEVSYIHSHTFYVFLV